MVEAILDYAKDNLVMFNIFIKASANNNKQRQYWSCLLLEHWVSSVYIFGTNSLLHEETSTLLHRSFNNFVGSLCQEVHEGWEDHQDCLHCQLWWSPGALHGLLYCLCRGNTLSLPLRTLLTYLREEKEEHKGDWLFLSSQLYRKSIKELCRIHCLIQPWEHNRGCTVEQ